MPDLDTDCDAVLGLIASLPRDGARTVVGIAGPPGSGKSTLAARVVDRLNEDTPDSAALMPMDGFHLDNAQLDAMGLRAVKGAPETFDAEGFVDLIRRVGAAGQDIPYPLFDRSADRTVPDAACLRADTPVVVVEGNYLLLSNAPWNRLKPLFDATVIIAPPIEVLEARLIDRWLGYGHSPEEAERKARGNDLVNARRVLEASAPADLTLPAPD